MNRPKDISDYLRANIQRIVALWEIRIRQEIYSAKAELRTVLRDEIPAFLGYMADSLSGIKETSSEKEVKALFDLGRK